MAIDWESVRADYSLGKFTVRDIGERHGVSHVAILKRVKKESWEILDRDLVNDAIEAQRMAKVTMNRLPAVTKLPQAIDKLAKIENAKQDLALLSIEVAKENLKLDREMSGAVQASVIVKNLTSNTPTIAIQNNINERPALRRTWIDSNPEMD